MPTYAVVKASKLKVRHHITQLCLVKNFVAEIERKSELVKQTFLYSQFTEKGHNVILLDDTQPLAVGRARRGSGKVPWYLLFSNVGVRGMVELARVEIRKQSFPPVKRWARSLLLCLLLHLNDPRGRCS